MSRRFGNWTFASLPQTSSGLSPFPARDEFMRVFSQRLRYRRRDRARMFIQHMTVQDLVVRGPWAREPDICSLCDFFSETLDSGCRFGCIEWLSWGFGVHMQHSGGNDTLVEFAYVSHAAPGMPLVVMPRLAQQAWSFNARMGITGEIRFEDGRFFQTIEGPCTFSWRWRRAF